MNTLRRRSMVDVVAAARGRPLQAFARLAWRLGHPAARERFVEANAPPPLVRVPFTTADGWRSSALFVPAAPGAIGEPVVIAHALGLSPDAYRYGTRATLVSRLRAEGFAVYLATWRGDREAHGPSGGISFDDIVERDLPAALDAVRAHSGFSRVFVVGHGFGGQAALAHAGRVGGEGLAGIAALCAPVAFRAPAGAALRVSRALAHLPGEWRVPVERLTPVMAAFVGAHTDGFGFDHGGAFAPDRLRGALWNATADVPVELLRQVSTWYDEGTLTDRTGLFDYTASFADAHVPLLVAYSPDDPLCPEDAALAAIARWGGETRALELPAGFGHHDVVFGHDADKAAWEPLARWLSARRITVVGTGTATSSA